MLVEEVLSVNICRSRVFVGNLATHKISREDIIQMFRAYGNLLGVTTFKGKNPLIPLFSVSVCHNESINTYRNIDKLD